MKKVIATLLKIAEIEKLQDLALVDPVEGVVLGDSGCCVRVYYSQKNEKWRLVVLEPGRMVYSDEWYDDEKAVLLATLNNFTLKKPAEEYVKEFFGDNNVGEKKANCMNLNRLPLKLQLLLSLYGIKLWPEQEENHSAYKSLRDSGLVTDPDKPPN